MKFILQEITLFFKKISFSEKLLYLFIILIPVMRVPSLPIIRQKVQYSDLVFLLLFSIWIIQLIKGKKVFLNIPLKYSLGSMLILFLFSFVNSKYHLISTIEFIGILYLACLYVLLYQLVDSKETWWRLIKCWCIVSLLISVTGIIAYILSSLGIYHGFLMVNHDFYVNANQHLVYRLCSVFRHPAMLTMYLHASIVFGFVLAVRRRNNKECLLGYLVVVLGFIAAILTKTRDIAGIAITLFLVLASMPKNNFFISVLRYVSFIYALSITFFVIVLTVWWVFPINFQKDQAQQKVSIEINTLPTTHVIRYKTQLSIMRDYPWVGVGLGMYNYKSADYINWSDVKETYHVIYPELKEEDENRYKKGIDPHSFYLGFGAETGFLGLGGLLFFFSRMIIYFLRKIKKEKSADVKYISQIFLAGLVGFLFNGLYFDILSLRPFWILIAMGIIYIHLFNQKKACIE